MSESFKGQLLCSLAMVLVGSTVVVSKIIGQDIEPFLATALRHALARVGADNAAAGCVPRDQDLFDLDAFGLGLLCRRRSSCRWVCGPPLAAPSRKFAVRKL